ncbi:beta-L-arabinofuranosidase domain-containing protein [Algibacillus agarilyticus]|uniref:beta-L-arabinofuranosidase domain-containing protein n=1 Tax=Algibacillus agarilyticus TaxID=2234133 RepID=UPI000DCFE812|nr:beta-L-arabinofuranosidase domain-containing protein [Algibacillus agarilyticus]
MRFRVSRKLVVVLLYLFIQTVNAAVDKIDFNNRLKMLPLSSVQITDGPFLQAQRVNLDYLLALEPDKLLAPYLREAGLETSSDSYGNWENTGLDGHMGGHYLTALSLGYAASGDERLYKHLIYMLAQLEVIQKTNGNGYLGGIPNGSAMWKDVAAGNIQADLFSMNKRWVPWYNVHKMFAGLRDAYLIAEIPLAKKLLLNYAEWLKILTQKLSRQDIQTMLITEHGGMNEVLTDMAEISGDNTYLDLAIAFSQQSILAPLIKQQDQLSGLHANTQIPKVIGFLRVSELSGDKTWQKAAEYFWDRVVNHRSTAMGGNSVKEHFHGLDDFNAMITDVEGPETCNTYNMLKLSKMLFFKTQDTRYLDYYERATYNHILSSQHPKHGGLVYFTSMRPGHYRKYSAVDKAMWCCVGSGIENHSKYGELIYNTDAQKGIYVNMFVASEIKLPALGVHLKQHTLFPDQARSKLVIKGQAQFKLHIRKPSWLAGNKMNIRLNGNPVTFSITDNHYLALNRHWQNGDTIEFDLPMQIKAEALPGNTQHYALVYGPVVLASKVDPFPNEKLEYIADDSRMGHIANGPMCPPEALPVILDDPDEFVKKIKAVTGSPLTFVAEQQLSNPLMSPVILVPFYRLHDTRYQAYWANTTPKALTKFRDRAAQAAAAIAELEALTIDKVAPGEQQPESDHFFKAEQSEAGVHMGRHWRHAHQWFSYELNDKQQDADFLRITYFGLDAGRQFSLWLNEHKLADVELKGDKGNDFFTVDYPISNLIASTAKGQYTLKFVAANHSIAGGIYGVRLMRNDQR